MSNLYKVTYNFTLPIRPAIVVDVEADCEEDIMENQELGEKAVESRGYLFGIYNYNPKPVKIELFQKNVK